MLLGYHQEFIIFVGIMICKLRLVLHRSVYNVILYGYSFSDSLMHGTR